MATNLVKFPYDLDESGEHQHFLAFRIYSNSSASLGGSSKSLPPEEDDSFSAPGEDSVLGRLDNSRGQKPNYTNKGNEASNKASIGKTLGDSAKAAANATFSESSYRSSQKVNTDAIYLPFPQGINMTDGWNWEMVSFQKTVAGEVLQGNVSEAGEKLIQTGAGAVGKALMENADKFMQHQVARVTNPRKESMFSEPNMRTYSFEFDLAPRNQKETNAAQTIIQLFKYHASPELYDGDNALYNYPSEFQIYFVSNGKENQYIGKIDRCALQNMSVNYTNANMWSAFKDTGAPTHLKISLEFAELSLQSRNSLKRLDGGE